MDLVHSQEEKTVQRLIRFYPAVFLFFLGAATVQMVIALLQEVSVALPTPSVEKRVSYSYEKIGWGPLCLDGMRTLGPIPELAKQLELRGCDTRPDAGEFPALLFELKGVGQQMEGRVGGSIRLRADVGCGFQFDPAGDIEMVPELFLKNGVVISIRAPDGREGRIELRKKGTESPSGRGYAKALVEAKALGTDLFLQQMGGREYLGTSLCQKIAIEEDVFFIRENSFLEWGQGSWVVVDKPDPFCRRPLAKLDRIERESVFITVWDETGFFSQEVQIPFISTPRTGYVPEALFTAFRSRGEKEVSCLLGKRRSVIREGDWWIKGTHGWKKIVTPHQLEEFISHRLSGELFIFDQVDCSKKSLQIRARCFDAMRLHMQSLSLTAPLDQKERLMARRGKKQGTSVARRGGDFRGHQQIATRLASDEEMP